MNDDMPQDHAQSRQFMYSLSLSLGLLFCLSVPTLPLAQAIIAMLSCFASLTAPNSHVKSSILRHCITSHIRRLQPNQMCPMALRKAHSSKKYLSHFLVARSPFLSRCISPKLVCPDCSLPCRQVAQEGFGGTVVADTSISTYQANARFEDRHIVARDEARVFAAVMDGHGGWQAAEFVVRSELC